jgi:uncharacterized protein
MTRVGQAATGHGNHWGHVGYRSVPMKLHEHNHSRMNLVSGHGHGEVLIHGERLATPCVVAPGLLLRDWIGSLTDLTVAAMEPVWPLAPRILLLGVDSPQLVAARNLARALRPALSARQAALEVMDLGAACRTYNVLAQEDRSVAALLFPADCMQPQATLS